MLVCVREYSVWFQCCKFCKELNNMKCHHSLCHMRLVTISVTLFRVVVLIAGKRNFLILGRCHCCNNGMALLLGHVQLLMVINLWGSWHAGQLVHIMFLSFWSQWKHSVLGLSWERYLSKMTGPLALATRTGQGCYCNLWPWDFVYRCSTACLGYHSHGIYASGQMLW